MDRLTKKIDGAVVFPPDLVGVTVTPDNEVLHRILTKLAEYEDAEENGEFLQEGDIVFCPKTKSEGGEYSRVDAIKITELRKFCGQISFSGVYLNERWPNIKTPYDYVIFGRHEFCRGDIGKTVFLSRTEAEASMKRMGE